MLAEPTGLDSRTVSFPCLILIVGAVALLATSACSSSSIESQSDAENAIRDIMNKSVTYIESRDWRNLYELFSEEFQAGCPYDEFLSSGNTFAPPDEDFDLGYDDLTVTVEGVRAFATYIVTLDGVDVTAVLSNDPDVFVFEDGRWKDDVDSHTHC